MTYIYLVRHCEAMGNHKRLFQGSTDCDISEIGAKQLEYLKVRFREIKLDAVYSSPLLRAQKTAESIACGKGISVITRKNLIPIISRCYDKVHKKSHIFFLFLINKHYL